MSPLLRQEQSWSTRSSPPGYQFASTAQLQLKLLRLNRPKAASAAEVIIIEFTQLSRMYKDRRSW